MNSGRFQQQFEIEPGAQYGQRVIVREVARTARGARCVLVRCLLCGREQVTRFHVLRGGADACLACANAGYRTELERFEDMTIPEPNSGCWLWLGRLSPGGYGMFSVGGRFRPAHRETMRLHGQKLSPRQKACHRCDNPPCANPEHVYAGTQKTNADDRERRLRGGGPKRRGEDNGRAELTWPKVRAIRAKWATRLYTKRQLGREYGVTDVQIGHIVSGRQWKE